MRSIYFKLCRELTFESLDKIGKRVGLDHATVLHGIKIFDTIIDNFWEKELCGTYSGRGFEYTNPETGTRYEKSNQCSKNMERP